jgi:hypothetical protein
VSFSIAIAALHQHHCGPAHKIPDSPLFVGSSEINANPKDTANWPKGVWTLPPTFRLGDQDRAKYEAIDKADNFVIKLRKPTR